jgi:N-methylhydantoinase A
MAEVEVFDGERMEPGQRVKGPAVVELATTTAVVPDDFDLVVDRTASFVLHRKGLEVDA